MKGAGRPKRMTERRWQIVGGYLMAAFFITAVYILPMFNFFDWRWHVAAIAGAMLGFGVGSHVVREWQEAGR